MNIPSFQKSRFGETIKKHVLSHPDANFAQCITNRLKCQFWSIVITTQMCQMYTFEFGMERSSDQRCCLVVRHMAGILKNLIFRLLG